MWLRISAAIVAMLELPLHPCHLMKRTIVVISLLTLIASAGARPPQQAEQIAGQLAQLLGTKEMFSAYLEQCSALNGAYDPKYVFKNDPAHFGGISPQSAY